MNTRVAIITGASRGIGAGLVAGYRRAGYAVVGVALSLPSSDDNDFVAVAGDIADAETAQRAVDQALDRFGRIDTLINNAGIYIGKPFTQYTVEDYAAITAVNLTGFFHITQRAIEQMVEQGSGHIVNISTSLVDHADSKRPAVLPALTKGGLVAASRSLAIEYASHGVRVNAVSLASSRHPPTTLLPTRGWRACTHWDASAKSATSSTQSSTSSEQRSSPARRSMSTAARQLVASPNTATRPADTPD